MGGMAQCVEDVWNFEVFVCSESGVAQVDHCKEPGWLGCSRHEEA